MKQSGEMRDRIAAITFFALLLLQPSGFDKVLDRAAWLFMPGVEKYQPASFDPFKSDFGEYWIPEHAAVPKQHPNLSMIREQLRVQAWYEESMGLINRAHYFGHEPLDRPMFRPDVTEVFLVGPM